MEKWLATADPSSYGTRMDLCTIPVEVRGRGTGYFKGAREPYATLVLWPSGTHLGQWSWQKALRFCQQGKISRDFSTERL